MEDCGGYGLKNGQLVSVAEVQGGLSCGCTCIRCGKALIAKKGLVRRHHFAHHEATDCYGAAETALHLLAKELFSQVDEIVLPVYEFERTRKTKSGRSIWHQEKVANGGRVRIQKSYVERRECDFVADVVVECAGKSLIIEIAVTHRVERAKLRKIRRHGLPAVEIQLELGDAYLSREELKRKIQEDLRSKHWLFHPKQREAERRFVEKVRAALAAERSRTQVLPAPTTRRSAGSQMSATRRSVNPYMIEEFERFGHEFMLKHGRYPTKKEGIKMRPHLFTRRKA